MAPKALTRLAIVGAVLVVAAFVAKHWPVWYDWTLQEAGHACTFGPPPIGMPCTAVAYGQLFSGLAMIAGVALLGFGAGMLAIRAVISWIKA